MKLDLEKLSATVHLPISACLEVGGDFIVLLDYYAASTGHVWDTLLRVRPDGTILWRVSPEGSMDRFIEIHYREGQLTAWSPDGYLMTLDPNSGRIIRTVFTK